MTITVYTKSGCQPCKATMRALDTHGIEYKLEDIAENGDALMTIKNLGYLQVPVVVTEEGHWAGFRPDKIAALAS